MSAGEDDNIYGDDDSFEAMVDNACSRLWDRKVRYSLRRIRELEEILEGIERELDELLLQGDSGEPLPAGERPSFSAPAGTPAPVEKLPNT
jgi:hypothetical protein